MATPPRPRPLPGSCMMTNHKSQQQQHLKLLLRSTSKRNADTHEATIRAGHGVRQVVHGSLRLLLRLRDLLHQRRRSPRPTEQNNQRRWCVRPSNDDSLSYSQFSSRIPRFWGRVVWVCVERAPLRHVIYLRTECSPTYLRVLPPTPVAPSRRTPPRPSAFGAP